jgi:hypothetical protein
MRLSETARLAVLDGKADFLPGSIAPCLDDLTGGSNA